MNDIKERKDIELLIAEFYQKAMADELIGHFFNEVVELNLETHLPKICDFWETTLLQNHVYKGNPIVPHLDLHRKSPMKKEHFDKWVDLFVETINQHFDGPTAELARQRAMSIATVMQVKIHQTS